MVFSYKSIKIISLVVFLIACCCSLMAQENNIWNHKKCAVVLTYDDALNTDIDHVAPLLDSLGLKATFYVSGNFPGFRVRPQDWKTLAEHGHELGNHSLFHPCAGDAPGREWVPVDYNLNHYTRSRLIDEITLNNVILKMLDGKTERTFAYPCGDTKFGDSSYVPDIQKEFVAARGVEGKTQRIDEINLYDIGCYMINGSSGDKMIQLVKNAEAHQALIVFLFHGVGGEHNINVSLEDHRMLLQYLKQHEQDIWIAPMVEVAKYIKNYQANNHPTK
ncbi:MAG TPA: polysaccharide deacetylase family protein [Bacteroidota bacterium]|nr:polysaccharide deacetylase family protein [Bacteroidota bacterium]